MNIKIHKGFWTRDEVARDVDSVYVFGDNVQDSFTNYIPSSTQAVIRNLENTVGIFTKLDRHWSKDSFYNDEMFPLFAMGLDVDITYLKQVLDEGKTIVFPEDGIGTGKAMLKEKAPMCWEYLCKRLKEEFNYDNGQDQVNP